MTQHLLALAVTLRGLSMFLDSMAFVLTLFGWEIIRHTVPYDSFWNNMGNVNAEQSTLQKNQLFTFSASPNPSSGNISMHFQLKQSGTVRVFDMSGRRVYTSDIIKGRTRLNWQTDHMPSGVYFVKLSAAGKTHSIRVTLAK